MILAQKLAGLKPREKIGLIVAGACVAVLMLDQFVIKGIQRKLAEMDVRIEEQKDRLNYARGVLEQRDVIAASYAAVTGMLRVASTPSVEINVIKEQLDELGRLSGVKIDAMEHQEPKAKDFCEEYRVGIRSFSGTIDSCLSYLNELPRADGVLEVTKITLAPDAAPDALPNAVKGSLTVTKVMLLPPGGRTEENR